MSIASHRWLMRFRAKKAAVRGRFLLTRGMPGQLGSPFSAGGAGTGTGLASQGALQISPDGRFLIAADAAAFSVQGGNLTELASSPAFLPAGATPAGIVVT